MRRLNDISDPTLSGDSDAIVAVSVEYLSRQERWRQEERLARDVVVG
jgi:hypothetical protein